MAPHQQRVVDEKAALDVKIEALGRFLGCSVYRELPAEEQDDLSDQRVLMLKYSAVLGRRIARF